MACSPTASWSEYLDLAGAVLTEPLVPDKGKIVARGPALASSGTRRQCTNMHSSDVGSKSTLDPVRRHA
jgi:hypothetical protein